MVVWLEEKHWSSVKNTVLNPKTIKSSENKKIVLTEDHNRGHFDLDSEFFVFFE